MRSTPSSAVLAQSHAGTAIFAWLYECDTSVFKGAPNGGKDSPPRLRRAYLELSDRDSAYFG
jgi:hypothetical protein